MTFFLCALIKLSLHYKVIAQFHAGTAITDSNLLKQTGPFQISAVHIEWKQIVQFSEDDENNYWYLLQIRFSKISSWIIDFVSNIPLSLLPVHVTVFSLLHKRRQITFNHNILIKLMLRPHHSILEIPCWIFFSKTYMARDDKWISREFCGIFSLCTFTSTLKTLTMLMNIRFRWIKV